MKLQHLFLSLLFALTVFPLALFGQRTLSGLEIIQAVYDRPAGQDQEGKLTMTLINSKGDRRVREIKQFTKDYSREEKKIMFFISPADVRNTSFMNWSYDESGHDDDQWIFLPALNKVKRISSDSKSDYFMGSDFTYDDLGDRHPTEDSHKLIREEKLNGEDCYVVESTPIDKDYMYSKTITWVIKGKSIGLKKEFYDEDGEHLKTLTVEKYEDIKGYLIITHSKMHNVQNGHTTDMLLEDLKVDSGIKDDQFTERLMKRGL